MTPWERKLWYDFLCRYPVRFQRQKPIDNYIVDFYCAKAKLVIELDGAEHKVLSRAQNDIVRSSDLEKMGLTVIRINNTDINRNFHKVCNQIDAFIKKQPSISQ